MEIKITEPEFKSEAYWEARYSRGLNSGSGSYGRLALFKARVVNDFIHGHQIGGVIEFGAGDGHQLSLLQAPRYVGYDVSRRILERLKALFAADPGKSFYHMSDYDGRTAELALSLDVIFHLVDDGDFEKYLTRLFQAAEKYVIIYSSNQEQQEKVMAPHFRHRLFTPWIEEKFPDWRLTSKIDNPFPFDGSDPENCSSSDFYIYSKKNIFGL